MWLEKLVGLGRCWCRLGGSSIGFEDSFMGSPSFEHQRFSCILFTTYSDGTENIGMLCNSSSHESVCLDVIVSWQLGIQ